MANDNTALELLIKTIADTSGVDQVQAALTKLKGTQVESSSVTREGADANAELSKKQDEAAESGEHLHVSHRALNMVARELNQVMPGLGEAIHMVHAVEMLGGVGAVMALVEAWKIWQDRVKEATEAMAGVEFPDTSAAMTQAKDLGQAWDGVSKAVRNAVEEFDSVDKTFDRLRTADEKTHERMQKTIDLQKEQRLANLELIKGHMTEAQYLVAKSNIEQGAFQARTAEDNQWDAFQLQRQNQKQKALEDDAKAQEKKANDMKLPKTQEEFDAQIKALEGNAAAYGKTAEDAKKRADALNETETAVQSGKIGEKLGAIPGAVKAQMTYGWGTYDEDTESDQRSQAKDAEEKQTSILALVERRKKEWEENKRIRETGAKESSEAVTLGNEIDEPVIGTAAQTKEGISYRNQTAGAQANIDVTKLTAETTKGGADIKQAITELHRAHLDTYADLINAFHQQAREIQAIKHQNGQ